MNLFKEEKFDCFHSAVTAQYGLVHCQRMCAGEWLSIVAAPHYDSLHDQWWCNTILLLSTHIRSKVSPEKTTSAEMKTVCWCQTAHQIQYVHFKTTEGQTATLSNVEQNTFWMRWDLKGTELKAIYSKVFVLSLTFTKETEAHLHLPRVHILLKYFSPAYTLFITYLP